MKLGIVLARWRWAEKLPIREAAKLLGISAATLSRIEHGQPMDGRTLGSILQWMLETEEA